MAKPQIVLVPGAWHDHSSLGIITSKLESLGYTVQSRQLPAVASSNPPKDLSEDVAAVRAMVDKAISTDNDVVVICHSWGGIVTGSALIGYSKQERETAGKKGGVISIGYMTAFLVPEDTSLVDAIGGKYPPWFDVKDPFVFAIDASIFYNDLPDPEQRHWFAKLQSQSLATLHDRGTGASWKNIPTSYLMCEDDLAIPVGAQEGMVKAARNAGVDVRVTRIKAGHSPFLSKPDETVEWIRGVAGEDV